MKSNTYDAESRGSRRCNNARAIRPAGPVDPRTTSRHGRIRSSGSSAISAPAPRTPAAPSSSGVDRDRRQRRREDLREGEVVEADDRDVLGDRAGRGRGRRGRRRRPGCRRRRRRRSGGRRAEQRAAAAPGRRRSGTRPLVAGRLERRAAATRASTRSRAGRNVWASSPSQVADPPVAELEQVVDARCRSRARRRSARTASPAARSRSPTRARRSARRVDLEEQQPVGRAGAQRLERRGLAVAVVGRRRPARPRSRPATPPPGRRAAPARRTGW